MEIAVIAHPNSKKPRVEKDMLGDLHAYVSEPPLEGKANRAVIDALADYFKVKRNCVMLISGGKSKSKVFEVLKD
jgi:uncharacterized protein YggU (UPF0235/DUF167 family)